MKEPLTDKIRIKHILDAIAEVEKYLAEVSYDEFSVNSENVLLQLNKLK